MAADVFADIFISVTTLPQTNALRCMLRAHVPRGCPFPTEEDAFRSSAAVIDVGPLAAKLRCLLSQNRTVVE